MIIPWGWQLTTAAVVASCAIGAASGYKIRDWQAIEAESKRQDEIKVVYRDRIQTVTKLGERVEVQVDKVRIQTRTLIKEVPIYVTKEAESRCIVPNGFVSLYNSSARGANPPAPSEFDEEASRIGLASVLSTSVQNNGTCREWKEQVIGLQEYIRTVVKPEGLSS